MIKNNLPLNDENIYFGASNSYRGFVSLFDQIFDRENFTKVFIIKGGPGTGKSTIMKSLVNRYANNFDIDAILCSSDPSSLDGVIISNTKARVAILDGTSPHTMDTVLPGAFDELVDLGTAFNHTALYEERDVLKGLNQKKKVSYKKAYDMLDICGKIDAIKTRIVKECMSYSLAERVAKTLTIEVNEQSYNQISYIFKSSFSKNGLQTIRDQYENIKAVRIQNYYGLGHIIMGEIYKILRDSKSIKTIVYNNLDPEKIDTIVTQNIIYKLSDSDYDISSQDIIITPVNAERLDLLSKIQDLFLGDAKSELLMASNSHFAMEKIYSGSVNFDIIDDIYQRLESKISNLLE